MRLIFLANSRQKEFFTPIFAWCGQSLTVFPSSQISEVLSYRLNFVNVRRIMYAS